MPILMIVEVKDLFDNGAMATAHKIKEQPGVKTVRVYESTSSDWVPSMAQRTRGFDRLIGEVIGESE